MNNHYSPARTSIVLLFLLTAFSLTYSQTPPTSDDRHNAKAMLSAIKTDLEKHYYDPEYRGMNLDERFKTAEAKIDQATTLAQVLGVVGQVLLDLDDSHTFFLPPGRTYKTDYGWQMKAIGDRCFVVAVKPKSDAEAKGLKEGDEIVSIDGLKPTRNNVWKILYLYHQIRPRPGMRLTVIKPNGEQQQLDVAAKVQEGKKVLSVSVYGQGYDVKDLILEAERDAHLNRQRYVEMGDVFVWKMPGFDQDAVQVRDMVEKVKKRKTLILDLRGNGGGYVDTLLALIENVFDREIKVGDVKRRKEEKEMKAKSRGKEAFAGKIIVLIDSGSASASELFARVVQLEKRGTVIGDRSAGGVMRSRVHSHTIGTDRYIPYAVSITDADIIMMDGKSLEHVGVAPDELKLPSANDLANKHDSVLAYALSLAGVEITAEKAGTLFPIEWKK
ncbi:MAG TPA: S41 family peptidase [Pyrinomonadaceae bacterium]|nr:S41 family peptidase [Pyrinomonadaceae bacterium]